MSMTLEEQLARGSEIMKQHGLKITGPRTQVLKALFKDPHAHTVYDLRRCDESLSKMNAVTLYRILEVFVQIGLAHRVSGNEFRACDMEESKHQNNDCHLLLICDECGSVQEVHDDRCRENETAKKYHFKIFEHVNEIHGVCKKCAS